MTTDLDKLEQVAKAATPGPWERAPVEYWGEVRTAIQHPKEKGVDPVVEPGFCCETQYEISDNNASFIAEASPSTVLELIERVRDYENVIREFAMNGMDVETLEHAAQVMEKWKK